MEAASNSNLKKEVNCLCRCASVTHHEHWQVGPDVGAFCGAYAAEAAAAAGGVCKGEAGIVSFVQQSLFTVQ